MSRPIRSKTLATWLGVVGGGLGLHRFYLHGLRDPWGWVHVPLTLVGLAGVQRVLAFERNEANAIIVHGTMCLVRRVAVDAYGGWSSDTICEDTDLGLAIIENGWLTHYTNRRYGHGLLPDTARRSRNSATAGPMAASRSSRSIGAASAPAAAS